MGCPPFHVPLFSTPASGRKLLNGSPCRTLEIVSRENLRRRGIKAGESPWGWQEGNPQSHADRELTKSRV